MVLGPERIEDGALDAATGVGLERNAAARVEPVGRVDETEHARGDQVVDVDALRNASGKAKGDPLREGRVGEDALRPHIIGVWDSGRLHDLGFFSYERSVALSFSNWHAEGAPPSKSLKDSGFL